MKLTIFTPTYNRGYIIKTLYESLKKQTVQDFEWLVIDDGSTDDTEVIFRKILNDKLIDAKYFKKENGGKHTAANFALNLAKGELFFVVDSDDYLADNAVERILFYYSQIENDLSFCGVCGLKAFFNGKVIGSPIEYEVLDTTIIDYRFHRKINGDKADVFRTSLLKQHRFPEYKNEKWCPLSIVWNRFGSSLKVRYFNEVLYYAEYLEDGISLNRNKIRRNSPKTTMQYYKELSCYDIPIKEKIKASINYWRFGLYSNETFFKLAEDLGVLKTLISFFPGYILFRVDQNKILNSRILDPKEEILNQQKNK